MEQLESDKEGEARRRQEVDGERRRRAGFTTATLRQSSRRPEGRGRDTSDRHREKSEKGKDKAKKGTLASARGGKEE